MFKKLREPVSGLMQLFAVVAASIGLIALLFLSRGDIVKWVSLFVYGLSVIFMFSASAAHHLVNSTPRVSQFLRKLDHASIYFLIAGTYTPICLHFFTGFWQ